jgi:hypothetical protein
MVQTALKDLPDHKDRKDRRDYLELMVLTVPRDRKVCPELMV